MFKICDNIDFISRAWVGCALLSMHYLSTRSPFLSNFREDQLDSLEIGILDKEIKNAFQTNHFYEDIVNGIRIPKISLTLSKLL